MDKGNKEELLRNYLDGELSDEQEQKALHVIADDSELRQMLGFERKLSSNALELEQQFSFQVPEGFTDSVMQAITSSEKDENRQTAGSQIKQWLRSWWQPRPVYWRPAYSALMAILMISLLIPIYVDIQNRNEITEPNRPANNVQRILDTQEQVWVRFVYIDDEAESIEVAGDFNGWEPISLDKQEVNGEQVWTGLVSMQRGEHRYMFVKDGKQWLTDPMAPIHREDGFGNKNAVIYL